MAAPLLHKKMRVELEFDVTMEAIDAANLHPSLPASTLPYLQALQAALLKDGAALLKLIQARLVSQMQAYTDNLARQDPRDGLRRLETGLDADGDCSLEPLPIDFDGLTYPLRVSCLSACLAGSTLWEEQFDNEGKLNWQPVWTDLRMQSPFGRWITSTDDAPFVGKAPETAERHHFLLRYLERQADIIRAEATCSCGLSFYGSGMEEGAAVQAAWDAYRHHLDAFGVGSDPANQALISKI